MDGATIVNQEYIDSLLDEVAQLRAERGLYRSALNRIALLPARYRVEDFDTAVKIACDALNAAREGTRGDGEQQ